MKRILLLITISVARFALGMELGEYNGLSDAVAHLEDINRAKYIKDIQNLLINSPSSVTLYENLLREAKLLASVLSSESSHFPRARLKELQDIRAKVKGMPQDINSTISQFLPISKQLSSFLEDKIGKMDKFIIPCSFSPVAICMAYDLEKNQQVFLGSEDGLFVWDSSIRKMKKLASSPVVALWCDTSSNIPIIHSYDGKNTTKWEWVRTFFGSFKLQATTVEAGEGAHYMYSKLVIGKDFILDSSCSNCVKVVLKYKIDEVLNKLYNFKTVDQSLFLHILGQYMVVQKIKNKKLVLDSNNPEHKELKSILASFDKSLQDALRGSLVIDSQFDKFKHEIEPKVKNCCACIAMYTVVMGFGCIFLLQAIFS